MAERLRQSHYQEKRAEFLTRLQGFKVEHPIGQVRLTNYTSAREWARKTYNKLSLNGEYDLPPIVGRTPSPEYCALLDHEVKQRLERHVNIREIAKELHVPIEGVRASRRRIRKNPSNLELLAQALGEQGWGNQKTGEILSIPTSTVISAKVGLLRRGIEIRLRRKRKTKSQLAQLDLLVQALREQGCTDEEIATYLHKDYYSITSSVQRLFTKGLAERKRSYKRKVSLLAKPADFA